MSRQCLFGDAVGIAATGAYLQREEPNPPWYDRLAQALHASLWRPLAHWLRDPAKPLLRILPLVEGHAGALRAATDEELQSRLPVLRAGLRRQGLSAALVGQSFALVREVAVRTLGQRHHDVQVMAAWALVQGWLAEMATGEGKSLTATLAASTVALAGMPVHVITVNDYLAARDAQAFAPLYRFLGLSVGTVVQGMPPEARRQAYACDVTYCTNKELAFDYLRDRVALGRRTGRLNLAVDALRGGPAAQPGLLLRGLVYGIVDEADSVFIDEARTPLILSAAVEGQHEGQMYRIALDLARALQPRDDYYVNLRERLVDLSASGKARLAELAAPHQGVWISPRRRHELVTQALSAILLFQRDKHYVVSDGRVQIVDEFTGRVMPDRSWERGLHQMIEAKEGCDLSTRRETLARITYQRLFRRYVRLAGMTGTAREVAPEVCAVYGLPSVSIPLHRPIRRCRLPGRLYASGAERWRAVADAVEQASKGESRPVLVGTRSVEASEQLSAVLSQRGIDHALLNARQDREEAAVIAAAGTAGRVTVATNMAGRGTDIQIDAAVAARGGLHVILTEFHASGRIDRQLFGRCARQGDPGSCEAIVALDDELFRVYAAPLVALVQGLGFARGGRKAPAWLLGLLRRRAQSHAERRDSRIRREVFKMDARLEKTLAFSGRHE